MDNVLEYEKLIYKMISKYKNFDQEDLYQVAMLGLMNAKRNYKPDENTKFSTYAYYYILGEINTYIKASNPVKISQVTDIIYSEVMRDVDLLVNL